MSTKFFNKVTRLPAERHNQISKTKVIIKLISKVANNNGIIIKIVCTKQYIDGWEKYKRTYEEKRWRF